MINWEKYKYKEIEDTEYKILYKENTSFWVLINETGIEIISLVKEGKSVEQIAEHLSSMYSLDYIDIIEDVKIFIDDMYDKISVYEKDSFENKDKIGDKSLTIHITNKCNLSCPYCYKDAKTKDVFDELSTEEIINVIKDATKVGFNYIIFSGGEPTIREDLFYIIDYIAENIDGVDIGIITNGTTNITDEQLDIIVKNVKSIQISLDSSEEEINSITRGKGSLQKIVTLIERLNAKKYKNYYFASTPTTSKMVNTASVEKLPSLLRFSANMGAKGLYVNMLKPDGRLDDESYSKFDIDEYWNKVNDTYTELKLLYSAGFHDLNLFAGSDFNHILEGYSYSINCGLGCSELSINHDGKVYPCSSLMKEEFLLGNIKSDNICDLYSKSKKIYSHVNVDNFEQCKDCEDRYICGGGCRALAYAYTRDIYGKNPHCNHCKERIMLWQMLSLNLYKKLSD